MITDLTGMPMSNASLLDEATAAAEAMTMCSAVARGKKLRFLVSNKCHPQTIAVCKSRAEGLGLVLEVGDHASFDFRCGRCSLKRSVRPDPFGRQRERRVRHARAVPGH